jgi:hypothetical protein
MGLGAISGAIDNSILWGTAALLFSGWNLDSAIMGAALGGGLFLCTPLLFLGLGFPKALSFPLLPLYYTLTAMAMILERSIKSPYNFYRFMKCLIELRVNK